MFLPCRNSAGRQKPFDKNTVLLAIHRDNRRGLRFTNPDGSVVNIGQRSNWRRIPGTENEGMMYLIPRSAGIGQSFISNTNPEAKWMALIFGTADRETYGNPIGLRLDHGANGAVSVYTYHC